MDSDKLKGVRIMLTKFERTQQKAIKKPRWKEYTLIKYEGKKVISKEKIWVDESKIFPSEEELLWKKRIDKKVEEAA